jgi:hypothetical protein
MLQTQPKRLSTDLLIAARAVYLLLAPDRLPCNTAPSILVIITKDRHYRIARIGIKEYTIQMVLHQVNAESGQIFTTKEETNEEVDLTTDIHGTVQFILKKIAKPIYKILLSTGLIDSDQFHKYSEFACIYYCDEEYCKEGCKRTPVDKENQSAGRKEYFQSAQIERNKAF